MVDFINGFGILQKIFCMQWHQNFIFEMVQYLLEIVIHGCNCVSLDDVIQ